MSRFMKLRVTNDGAEKRGEPLFVHFRWLLLKKKIWQLVAADKVGFNEACNWSFRNKPGFKTFELSSSYRWTLGRTPISDLDLEAKNMQLLLRFFLLPYLALTLVCR